MDGLRAILAGCCFCISCYLLYDLIANGFDWLVLGAIVTGFVLAHYLWPSNSDNDHWYDIFELLVDLPYRAIALLLRGFGRAAKDGDIGIDL